MYNNISDWDRMVEGKFYNADSIDIGSLHLEGRRRCQKFNRISVKRVKAKQKALEKLIPSSKGKGFTIFSPFYCEYGINIHVGKCCFINYNCTFLDIAPITLGDNVWIGGNVTIATPMHPLLSEERLVNDYPDGRHDLEYSKPVTIGDNTWICSSVTITAGVTIGKNCVIGAGSVVTKDIPDDSLAYGVPCQVVRKIDEEDRMNAWETYEANGVPTSFRKRK